MTIDADQLRRLMRLWTTGVTVVTARADGQTHGMTVSAFTSISLDPPLVLVSLANTTLTGDLIRRGGHFGVTILAEGQERISDRFAGRSDPASGRFDGLTLEQLSSGVPFLQGGLAFLDCRLVAAHPGGTSTLYIGEVTASWQADSGRPLVFFDREYQDLCAGG